jgi:hypothetical protein
MTYVIKEHTCSPFDVSYSLEERNKGLLGYLTDINLYTLDFRTSISPYVATKLTLSDASLFVSKINKLNLRFYEIEEYEPNRN